MSLGCRPHRGAPPGCHLLQVQCRGPAAPRPAPMTPESLRKAAGERGQRAGEEEIHAPRFSLGQNVGTRQEPTCRAQGMWAQGKGPRSCAELKCVTWGRGGGREEGTDVVWSRRELVTGGVVARLGQQTLVTRGVWLQPRLLQP